jgi:hypothetical protein
MNLTEIITGSIAVLSIFVGLPVIILSFIHKNTKNKIRCLKGVRRNTTLNILENVDKKI